MGLCNNNTLKNILNPTLLVMILGLVLFSSCTTPPMSKESYFDKYEAFLKETKKNQDTYTVEDWKTNKEEFKKFTGEWHEKFKDEFTWKDELLVAKNQIQYGIISNKGEAIDIINGLKGNVDKIKSELKKYMETDMEGDLDFLKTQIEEVGGTAADALEEILKELEEKKARK